MPTARPVHHPGLLNTKVLARSSDTAATRSAPPKREPSHLYLWFPLPACEGGGPEVGGEAPGPCGGVSMSFSTAVGDASRRVPYLLVPAEEGRAAWLRGCSHLPPCHPCPFRSQVPLRRRSPTLATVRQPLQAPPEFALQRYHSRAETTGKSRRRGTGQRASPGCCLPPRWRQVALPRG